MTHPVTPVIAPKSGIPTDPAVICHKKTSVDVHNRAPASFTSLHRSGPITHEKRGDEIDIQAGVRKKTGECHKVLNS